jgi:hypothetical protein
MQTMRILGLAVAVAAVVPLLSMPHVSAQPVAGASYTGTHSGDGDIDFDVSAEGDQVLNLTFTDIPCDGGTHDVFTWPPSPPADPLMIVDDQFEGTLSPLLTTVTGQFPTAGSANGTFLLDLGDCQSPELTWTATITTPAVGGVAELPDVSDSSTAGYAALAGLAVAALVALTAGGWYAGRRWLR